MNDPIDRGSNEPTTAPSLAAVDPPIHQPNEPAELELALSDAAEAVPDDRPPRWWQWAVGALVVVGSLLLPLSASGIWDPYELVVAELGRRIAIHVFGASSLALEGANNAVVSAGQLGRGELPFTSIALGFRWLGLHEWAGRLPLGLWGVVGVVATAWLLARLADTKTGILGAIALATTPLYFLHARTMLGDVVTMAAAALATAGLGLAVFDEPAPPSAGTASRRALARRVGALLVGAAGLVAGVLARGVLIGVGIPTLGVGVAWVIVRFARGPSVDRFSDLAGGLAALFGAGALGWGIWQVEVGLANPGHYSPWLGVTLASKGRFPTFDTMIGALGHSLFPWSAFVPLAIGRMTTVPVGCDGPRVRRESALRTLLLAVACVGFAIQTALCPVTGALPFSAVFALAAIAALCIRDWERGASASPALALCTVGLLALFVYDFQNFPDRALSAFAVDGAKFPESFQAEGRKLLALASTVMAVPFFFSWLENSGPGTPRFVAAEYLAYPRALRGLYRGNLWFGLLVAEATLAGFATLSWLSHRFWRWPRFETMGTIARKAAELSPLALPLLLAAPVGALLVRDMFRWFYARVPVSRAWGGALGLAGSGMVLSLGYYPAMAAHLSPKGVFDSYRRSARLGEPLALLGVSVTSASYYAGGPVATFDQVAAAFEWLTSGSGRRWLVLGQKDLAQLNSLYRGGGALPGTTQPPRTTPLPKRNLPVIDARSSEILLASSSVGSTERSNNPLDAWVLDVRPTPSHPLGANLGGQLDALGWDVTTLDGRAVSALAPGERYQFRIAYQVVAPISGKWDTFIHIDGHNRRFNGDHETLGGKYPMQHWQPGDYILDIYPFTLEPSFVPGTYSVYYGLFSGNRRLEVKRGPQQEDRIVAGAIEVR
jgi:4-amino-4-deoxy-L-arabinose transferase-like glycosyltransferase